uniref:Peptidase M50 domain-containing protein n=1 Tax=Aegilops tauschii subsp. strangulata TaxID=200361 RepID=A0A453ICL6_AEGTS
MWRTFLLTPFKLITVFLHETSHALACKLTCGDVEGMQVHANEGGVTQTRGGIYWIILPAGYLGSSFWGMVFILSSTHLLATRIAAGCFILALVIVLFVAKNWFLRWLCIGMHKYDSIFIYNFPLQPAIYNITFQVSSYSLLLFGLYKNLQLSMF